MEPAALLPCALEFLTKLALPAATVFVPLYAAARGIPLEVLLVYYLGYGIVGVASRGPLGGWADRLERRRMIALGSLASSASLLLLAAAQEVALLTLGGVFFGLGAAASAPSIMALAINVSHAERPWPPIRWPSSSRRALAHCCAACWPTSPGYPAMFELVALIPMGRPGAGRHDPFARPRRGQVRTHAANGCMQEKAMTTHLGHAQHLGQQKDCDSRPHEPRLSGDLWWPNEADRVVQLCRAGARRASSCGRTRRSSSAQSTRAIGRWG